VVEGLRGDINDAQRRALSLALNGIERLGRIIDDLLDISKIESGKVALKLERLDLAALAREAGSAFQSLAEDRALELRVTTPAGPVMSMRPRRLVQVLTNLVNNSFSLRNAGISKSPFRRGRRSRVLGGGTGMGLARRTPKRSSTNLSSSAKWPSAGKGTGLGLSICAGSSNSIKAHLGAKRRHGQGARVAFVIPRQTGREVFRDQLVPVLHNVARRGGSLSTVVFQVEQVDSPPVPNPNCWRS